jgi:hypothetical protein
LSALAAAGLLIALFAGLLARQAALRPVTGVTPTTASGTATATPDAWSQVAGYHGLNDLAVAPSDPRVAYQFWTDASGKALARRTDDQGATWQTLTLPSIPHATYPIFGLTMSIHVSPSDAHAVYIHTSALMDSGVTSCGPAGQQQDGPQVRQQCLFQFISVDSGAHWQALSLPVAGIASGGSLTSQSDTTVHPPATHLYDLIGALQSNESAHLVRSDDGGASWQAIDAPLTADNQAAFAFAATPVGSTIFALTTPIGQPTGGGASPPLTIWHSDDAGATWEQLGPAPNQVFVGMSAALVANSGKPILYLLTADKSGREYIQGSLFGASGSFHVAPDMTPPCQSSGNAALLATQPDGSVVAWCDGAIESWLAEPARVSGGWRTVAANPGLTFIQSAFTQRLPDGSARLWLLGNDSQGATVEYTTLNP